MDRGMGNPAERLEPEKIFTEELSLRVKLADAAYAYGDLAVEKAIGLMPGSEACAVEREDHKGPFALVVQRPGDPESGRPPRLYVSVRGTQINDLRDVCADYRFFPRLKAGGCVHRGFAAYSGQLQDLKIPSNYSGDFSGATLHRMVRRLRNHQVVFIGHSLGGAAATHIARSSGLFRSERHLSKPELTTLGCPLVGSRSFCRQTENACLSVTHLINHRDPVPLLALWPLYRRPRGLYIWYNVRGKVLINPSLSERVADRVEGIIPAVAEGIRTQSICAAIQKGMPIHHHYCVNYVRLTNEAVVRIQGSSVSSESDDISV